MPVNKKIYLLYRYLLLAVAVLMSGMILSCRGTTTETDIQLATAESLMDKQPDSAKSILRQIDTKDIRNERQHALHSLLTVYTKVKSRENLVGDSLIDTVVNYYDNSGDEYHKSLAQYCKGYELYQAKDYANSLIILLEAYENALKCGDSFRAGKTAILISAVYHATYNPEIGLKYAQMSYDHFVEAGDKTETNYGLMNLARFHHSLGNHEKTVELAPIAAEKGKESGDMELRASALQYLGNTYVHMERYKDACDVFNLMTKEGIMNSYDSCLYIYAQVRLGNLNKARDMIRAISLPDSCFQLTLPKSRYYLAVGDTGNAYRYLDIFLECQSELFTDKYDDGILTSVENFREIKKKLHEAQLRSERTIKWTIIIVGSIIVILTILFLRWRNKLQMKIKDAELEANMERIQSLTAAVTESEYKALKLTEELDDNRRRLQNVPTENDSATTMQGIIANLFKNQWKTLNILCNEYFEKGDTALRSTILNEVEKEIKQVSGRQGVRKIEEALDAHFNGIISRLREQLPKLTEKDITFLIFTYAGFSPRAICLFTGYTLKYYYKKRAVIKEKILSSEAPDRHIFADMME